MANQGKDLGSPEEAGVPVPMPLVISRIIVVTAVGVASSLGLFMIVAGWWLSGSIVFASTFAFILLMFYIERIFGQRQGEEQQL